MRFLYGSTTGRSRGSKSSSFTYGMKGWPSTSTFGFGGVIASMVLFLSFCHFVMLRAGGASSNHGRFLLSSCPVQAEHPVIAIGSALQPRLFSTDYWIVRLRGR